MVAITYNAARDAAPAVAAEMNKGFFARFFTRFLMAIERSQLRRAERDLGRYPHLLPLDHDLYSGKLVQRNEKAPQFGGW